MPSYSTELKGQIVKKMMPPNNQRVSEISSETGISEAALCAWKEHCLAKGYLVPAKKMSPIVGMSRPGLLR